MIEEIDALLAFIQHYRNAAVLLSIAWAVVAFLALCAVALADKRLQGQREESEHEEDH